MLGEKASSEWLDSTEVRRSVLDNLIEQRVLLNQALAAGLTVTDAQLRQFIANIPAFQDEGKFSPARYEAVLRSQGYTPIAFENRLRQDMLRQQVSSLQESLDYLRLSIKYLVFDLEATRRENGYLRRMLEETHDSNDE